MSIFQKLNLFNWFKVNNGYDERIKKIEALFSQVNTIEDIAFKTEMAKLQTRSKEIEDKIVKEKKYIWRFSWLPWLAFFVGLGSIFGIIYYFCTFVPTSEKPFPSLSDIGSIFSGITGTLFALTGLLFVYLAFLKQKEQTLQQQYEINLTQQEQLLMIQELQGQKSEMEGQRKALEQQQQEMEEQNQTMAQQRFESTFFQLLDYLKGYIGEKRKPLATNSFFPFYSEMKSYFGDWHKDMKVFRFPADLYNLNKEILDESGFFENFFLTEYSIFNPFFSQTTNIILYVDNFVNQKNDENEFDYKFYIDIIKALLLENEIKVLYYFGITKDGKKFKVLAEKYHFFESIKQTNFLNPDHKNLYSPSAFDEDNS